MAMLNNQMVYFRCIMGIRWFLLDDGGSMISMCPLQILKYWMMEIALEPRSSQRNMCAQIQAAIFGGVCFKLKDTKKSERTCLYHLVSMFEVNIWVHGIGHLYIPSTVASVDSIAHLIPSPWSTHDDTPPRHLQLLQIHFKISNTFSPSYNILLHKSHISENQWNHSHNSHH